jgi:hypothetical protein
MMCGASFAPLLPGRQLGLWAVVKTAKIRLCGAALPTGAERLPPEPEQIQNCENNPMQSKK